MRFCKKCTQAKQYSTQVLTDNHKAGIPFLVYERDENVSVRGQGWGLTVHWALPFLRDLLSPEAFFGLEKVQVDPEIGRNDTGNFLFLNLETLEVKYKIPPAQRLRLDREKLRKHLLTEVSQHVNWNKRLVDIKHTEKSVLAIFQDGSEVEGAILIGAEGTNSQTRKFLMPETYKNVRLPVRLIGTGVDFTAEAAKPLRDIDPLLFMGCHPKNENSIWVSILESPEVNGTKGTDHERYRVQFNVSWSYKSADDEVKSTNDERLAQMKYRAKDFHPILRDAVNSIPETANVLEIILQDWPGLGWESHGDRVTLAGDAAHAMTMFRGEAANHGMLDALRLCQGLSQVYQGNKNIDEAIKEYEVEMKERTIPAVLLSRQACLDAHTWDNLNSNSAVLRRRARD